MSLDLQDEEKRQIHRKHEAFIRKLKKQHRADYVEEVVSNR